MHRFITLVACLLLAACASNQQALYEQNVQSGKSPIAATTFEAIHNTEAIPLPVNTGLLSSDWSISANEPRMNFGRSISNYRVFSLQLKKGMPYSLSVKSVCNEPCQGFNKFALKPRAMLLDSNGAVIAKKPSKTDAVLGQITLNWVGTAPEDGTYYLLVAADNDDLGRTIVIDDAWLNDSPLMAVDVGMHSSPFGKVSVFANPTGK